MTRVGTPPLAVDRHWIQKLLEKHHGSSVKKALVVAPMVDQSDLPFRMLCRQYGANLCFTPMIHAKLYVSNKGYRERFLIDKTPPEDRPLIAQICGGDVDTVVKCALLLEPFCDGIDVSLLLLFGVLLILLTTRNTD